MNTYHRQRTALRADIRNLEAENEAVHMSNRFLESENHKLRRLIDVYIRSAELNDPVWDIMRNEDMFNTGNGHNSNRNNNARYILVFDQSDAR